MKKITLEEYNKICEDYRGIYIDFWGDHPELKGKRTMLQLINGITTLVIEGIDFEIIEQ